MMSSGYDWLQPASESMSNDTGFAVWPVSLNAYCRCIFENIFSFLQDEETDNRDSIVC